MRFFMFPVCTEIIWSCTSLHYTLNQTYPCACSPPQRASRLVNPVQRKVWCQKLKELWITLYVDSRFARSDQRGSLTFTIRPNHSSMSSYQVTHLHFCSFIVMWWMWHANSWAKFEYCGMGSTWALRVFAPHLLFLHYPSGLHFLHFNSKWSWLRIAISFRL